MKIVKTSTEDGLILNGLLSEPGKVKNKIIINIHGMAGSIVGDEFYVPMHHIFPEKNIAFLAGENRGVGSVTGINSKSDRGYILMGSAFEIFENCVFDIKAWVDYALGLGYTEIWLQGHSLGCSKVAYYLKEQKDFHVNGAILLSPADMIGLLREPSELENFKRMQDEATNLIREGRGYSILQNKVWGSEIISANTFKNLFGDNSNVAIFNFFDESLGWETVKVIDVPVLALTGTLDDGIVPVMDPYKAMEKLKLELKKSPKVKALVYSGAEHSFDGFGEKIVIDILDFINQ